MLFNDVLKLKLIDLIIFEEVITMKTIQNFINQLFIHLFLQLNHFINKFNAGVKIIIVKPAPFQLKLVKAV